MSVIISAIAFLLLLTVLVILHELGHFAAARKAGVIVEEFGFGLPPRAKALFRQGGTLFSLNWIPFGGFVRLRGENAVDERERRAPGSFANASILWRIIILTAGVFMNFVFAIVIFTGGFSFGQWIPTYLEFEDMLAAAQRGEISMKPAVLIEDIVSGGTAAQVGVPRGAIILKIDGQDIEDPAQVAALQLGRENVLYTVLLPTSFTEEETFNVPVRDGKTGVAIRSYLRDLRSPERSFLQAFRLALREAGIMTVQTVKGIAQLFQSLAQTAKVPEGITGIVGIAQLTHESVLMGWQTYLRLVALLSLSLAVLNILPLPALDGGRLLFVLIEAVRRRPANRRFELITNAVGFALLLFLILVITFHDIIRLF